jgi:hypothetical protein
MLRPFYTGDVAFPLCLLLLQATTPDLSPILSRVSEEAEMFFQNATRMVASETQIHRAALLPSRFRFRRAGEKQALEPVRYEEKTIVSEYGFSTFREAPDALREFRQVVSVNGRRVLGAAKARLSLAENMTSDDDRLRRQMLLDFEKHGIKGAVADFGQLLLMFQRRRLPGYVFTFLTESYSGADPVITISYTQKNQDDFLRIYHGRNAREMIRVPMSGTIVARKHDGLPVRITMQVKVDEEGNPSVHEAAVNYITSRHGFLVPSDVLYKKTQSGILFAEIRSTMAQHQVFKAEAEIRFESADAPPETPK